LPRRHPSSNDHPLATRVSQIVASTGCDLFRAGRRRIGATVRAFVVTTAGPCVLPHGPAAVAFIVVDESGLTVGLMVPLMLALSSFVRQRCDP
jgi:hypothetical protein